jgi:Zn-dependent protease with chaperone function
MFAGFLISGQVIALVLLAIPLLFLEPKYCPLFYPLAYFSIFGWPIAGISLIVFLVSYYKHLDNVQALSGFERVSKIDEPRLCRIVEKQAMLAGLPMPKVAVIPSEACNAFAAGLGRSSATIVVTRGLLESLDDEQLEAVVAHEIAHIVNGDIGAMAAANAMLSSLLRIAKLNPWRLDKWYKLVLCVLLFPLFFMFLAGGLVSYVGTTLAMLSRYMIASSREFIADAQAVQMTKNPAALISALRVIEGRSTIKGLDPRLDAMMIDGATSGTYASHPPLHERIAVLSQLVGGMASTFGRRKDTRPGALRSGSGNSVPTPAITGNAWIAQIRTGLQEEAKGRGTMNGAARTNLLQRLNSESRTTAFGMTPGIQTFLKYVLIAFLAYAAFTTTTRPSTTGVTAPSSVKNFETIDRDIKPAGR